MKTRKLKDGYDRREGRGVVHVRLSSSETGVVLGKIVVPEGGRVDIGQMVAVLSDAPDSADIDEASIAAAAAARVAANMPDAGELDPFE
jgi:pyruvate/2-oxoglutarate dehydrogenase complex dihydrolipoamide acyltransferase (E2) component